MLNSATTSSRKTPHHHHHLHALPVLPHAHLPAPPDQAGESPVDHGPVVNVNHTRVSRQPTSSSTWSGICSGGQTSTGTSGQCHRHRPHAAPSPSESESSQSPGPPSRNLNPIMTEQFKFPLYDQAFLVISSTVEPVEPECGAYRSPLQPVVNRRPVGHQSEVNLNHTSQCEWSICRWGKSKRDLVDARDGGAPNIAVPHLPARLAASKPQLIVFVLLDQYRRVNLHVGSFPSAEPSRGTGRLDSESLPALRTLLRALAPSLTGNGHLTPSRCQYAAKGSRPHWQCPLEASTRCW